MKQLLIIIACLGVTLGAQAPLDELAVQIAQIRTQIVAGRSRTQTVTITTAQLARLDAIDALIARLRTDGGVSARLDGLTVEIAALRALHLTPPPLPPSPSDPPPPPPPVSPSPPPPSGSTRRLLQQSDLVYAGGFRVGDAFSFGGDVLAWNPARQTLLIQGGQGLGEVSVPALTIGAVTSMQTATLSSPTFDPFEGKRREVKSPPEPTNFGGAWTEGNNLYMTAWVYYDANHGQTTSHFIRPLDFADRGHVQGPFATSASKQAYVAGSFMAVPPEWQTRIGGRVLNGLCCTPIISRTSSGASAWLINPTDVGMVNPIPVTPLVYYPINHLIDPPRGGWQGDNTYYNGSGSMGSAVWPVGTDTILFFGSTGLGEFCYGEGTNQPGLHKTPVGGSSTDIYCYDPTQHAKSQHAFPYVPRVWAYDAADLLAVTTGARQPWELLPYAWWDLALPAAHPQSPVGLAGFNLLGGVTYDPATGRIFVSVPKADTPQSFSYPPLIHTFTVRP